MPKKTPQKQTTFRDFLKDKKNRRSYEPIWDEYVKSSKKSLYTALDAEVVALVRGEGESAGYVREAVRESIVQITENRLSYDDLLFALEDAKDSRTQPDNYKTLLGLAQPITLAALGALEVGVREVRDEDYVFPKNSEDLVKAHFGALAAFLDTAHVAYRKAVAAEKRATKSAALAY